VKVAADGVVASGAPGWLDPVGCIVVVRRLDAAAAFGQAPTLVMRHEGELVHP
jgi:hypothetical protein